MRATKGHAGDPARIDRANREPVIIDKAVISACVMIQPDSLRSLGEIPSLRESGFLARWLYIVPDTRGGDYPTETIPENVKATYHSTITSLIDYPWAQYPNGDPAPHLLEMSSEAFLVWKDYHDATKREISKDADILPPVMQSWLGKLPEHVARLALLNAMTLHISEDEKMEITADGIHRAIMLAECLKAHAMRATGYLGDSASVGLARKAWRWIDSHRSQLESTRGSEGLLETIAVKPRDLQRTGITDNAKQAREILQTLDEHGHVRAMTAQGKDGKTIELYVIRPVGA